ncbi:MAG: F0F1 ATP synthase subunit A [Prevotellaceae bacterium]|jgi:F-type H+-transporting ATPase subunit a|nr:F0F1 ATP synthase subunit A [Prevotellaceae bacterium]
MNKRFKFWQILLLLFFAFAPATQAAGQAGEHEAQETFDAGKFIFGHIRDDYNWHITNIGEHPISIPLPVIVKSAERGWFVFSASKFEHGHAAYEGFHISQDKATPGKIMEILPDGSQQRPLDLSITKNALSIIISGIILLWIFLSITKIYKRNPMVAPKGFHAAMEVLVLFILDEVIKPCIGKNYARYTPYLLTVFFFILLNNIMGIIPIFPGGATVTGNIAVTLVLAVFTFLFVNIFGTKEYWKDIFLVPAAPAWLKLPIPIMPLLEFVGVISKPFALMIRLFANMLAGHIIALVFMALIFIFGSISPYIGTGVGVFSVLFAICMNILELLVIFIQAYVFTLLSAVFIGLSQLEPHGEHAH